MATSQSKEFLDPKAIITITIHNRSLGIQLHGHQDYKRGDRSGLCLNPALLDRFDLWRDLLSPKGTKNYFIRTSCSFMASWWAFCSAWSSPVSILECFTRMPRGLWCSSTPAPFVVAIGAHLFIRGDRLSVPKIIGLVIAFAGIYIVFQGRPKAAKETMLLGDILQIMAAIFWGATTVYIKKFMAEKIHPINTFLYQLIFSTPILLIVSLILEKDWVYQINFSIVTFMFYQSIIVAFISYLIWFKLIHTYSVSRLSAFTFFTPIFGVLFGILFLKEELTVSLMIGLPLVCLGIYLVNWRKRIGSTSVHQRLSRLSRRVSSRARPYFSPGSPSCLFLPHP